jgi:hypothetical protein
MKLNREVGTPTRERIDPGNQKSKNNEATHTRRHHLSHLMIKLFSFFLEYGLFRYCALATCLEIPSSVPFFTRHDRRPVLRLYLHVYFSSLVSRFSLMSSSIHIQGFLPRLVFFDFLQSQGILNSHPLTLSLFFAFLSFFPPFFPSRFLYVFKTG